MTGAGRARDEGGARAAALRINARVAGVADSFLVRVALRGVLSGFSARSQGDTIEIELPVSPPQMDAVLSLLGAHVGARFDAEDQASEVNDQASPRQSSPTSARLPGRAARD